MSLRHLLAFLLFACAGLPVQADTLLRACRLPDFPQEVRCGQIERALDPAAPQGKKITVHYVVLPSQDKNKLSDAVFLLAGGPGQSAIALAATAQVLLGRLNQRRDLVFIDQRGTGRSAPLNCPSAAGDAGLASLPQSLAQARSCLQQLQGLPYGDLRFFSTSIAVQDIEAVRLQLSYPRINVLGISYGSRVGLEYQRQFPQALRRLVLDGVVPPSLGLPNQDAQAALDAVFADCAEQAACRASYPELPRRWKELLSSLPRPIRLTHPRLGTPLQLTMRREILLNLVQSSLYQAEQAAALPYLISAAWRGDFAPLITVSAATNAAGAGAIAAGMHFSVWCSEAYARTLPAAQDDFDANTRQFYDQVCRDWPRARIPPDFFSLPAAASPVLLLSGGIDPVTPTRHAAAVTAALGPLAVHLTLAHAGHGMLAQGCVRELVFHFIDAASAAAALELRTGCLRPIPRALAWQPLTPAGLP